MAVRGRAVHRAVRVPKASELIADQLRGQIIRGELQDGDLLPNEAILVERFGVSRPTLREALRILESERFLKITRGSRDGARVATPSEHSAARYVGRYLQFKRVPVIDVHEALMAIEVPAVERLAANWKASDMARLEASVQAEKNVDADWLAAIAAGTDFHGLILELAGNRTLAIMHALLDGVIFASGRDIGRIFQPEAQASVRRWRSVHEDVVRLIREHAVADAADLWRRHLRAKVRLLENMQSMPGEHADHALVDVLSRDDIGPGARG
jgi:DNA-binding FadR family transcriptional regulator